MRFQELKDIISEASIWSRTGAYKYGHMVRISTGSRIGEVLLDKIQQEVPDFDPEERLEWIQSPVENSPKIQAGTGSTKLHFKRPNESGFTLVGTPTAIEKGLLHAERYNRGDIAEAILGASLTAKLIKRGSDRIGTIGDSDVKAVLARAVKAGDELSYTVEDKKSQIADKIVFTLRLPSGSMNALKNPDNWDKFGDLFTSAAKYVNSGDAEKYSNHFYQNGKVDEVYIISDGVSNQKGRKTDVQAVVKDPATGKVRDLRNVDISLKADSNIYGQQGTGGLQAGKQVWLQKAQLLFGELGVSISMPARHTDITDFWRQVYKQATKQLNQHFSHYTATQETVFIEKLANLIEKHGSAGNKNLKLLSFEKGDFSIHSFSLVKQRLIAAKIDFGAELTIGPRSGKPSIIISDRSSGKVLTAIRYFQSGDKSSNYFEKGPLLHDLTKIAKYTQQPAKPAAPAATQATATATTATPTQAAPTQPVATTAPTAQGPGKSVTTVAPGMAKSANPYTMQQPDEEPVTETGNDKDLDYIRRMSGIISQMSKRS